MLSKKATEIILYYTGCVMLLSLEPAGVVLLNTRLVPHLFSSVSSDQIKYHSRRQCNSREDTKTSHFTVRASILLMVGTGSTN